MCANPARTTSTVIGLREGFIELGARCEAGKRFHHEAHEVHEGKGIPLNK
jgi:hypothetical protein